jgi:hypothetical protein
MVIWLLTGLTATLEMVGALAAQANEKVAAVK